MKTHLAKTAAAPCALTLLIAFAAFADSINPATKPQTSPAMDAKEKPNLQFVMDWWRDVVEGGHLDLTTKYQQDDYIQHNPNVPTGREAFVAFFRDVVQVKPKNPIPATLTDPPVVSGAKGDFVFLIFEREQKHPADASKTYRSNSFEVLRLQNGKVQEHWDSAKRTALPPGAPKPAAFEQQKSQMARGSLGTLSAEEKRNLDIGVMELKDMLQYGHLELADKVMDPGYLQHNPNVPQGRDGFKQYMSRTPGRTPQEIKPEWVRPPSLTLVSGPYVVFMFDRTDKDPNDPSKDYVWNHFDVIRVENGLIKEHWDEAVIAPPPR
ncbi:MAG TPA: nuclear transport factor 2 family protein [Gammaproteobacteria bacterium]|nr:nuclear transport factor 2 family protein [Gammaproteobacteria bacterium]